jgi:hypothetical protein
MNNIQEAMSDTCVFMIGVTIGFVYNHFFEALELEEKHEHFIYGLMQIFVNAYTIHIIRKKYEENMVLFVLGILMPQTLTIRMIFHQ